MQPEPDAGGNGAVQSVRDRTEAFAEKAYADLVGAMTVRMCSLGERLGLFQALADSGPVTSAELAARVDVDERYIREWLAGMACAGYLRYEPAGGSFTLPAEHIAVLARERDPLYLGGSYEAFPATLGAFDDLVRACRQGGGIPFAAYGEHLWSGMSRWTSGWVEQILLPGLALLPEVVTRLCDGAAVADIGAGGGDALIQLARAYPASLYVGYDIFAGNVALATRKAGEAGLAGRVRFVGLDAADGLPETYDLITALDVLHDLPRLPRTLSAIRSALRPGGSLLVLEHDGAEAVEGNIGPWGALLYSSSLFYCLPTSMHQGGEGLGALGLPEPRVRELCREAGFAAVARMAVDHPALALYEARG